MGVLARVPRGARRPDLPLRGHARAVHRRRADGVLQRPGARATTRPSGRSGWRVAMRDRVRELAERWRAPGPRPRLRHRHRPGLRDPRPDRLRGPLRLRRDRQRHQPRRPAVRRGRAVADPRHPAGARRRRGRRRRRAASATSSCAGFSRPVGVFDVKGIDDSARCSHDRRPRTAPTRPPDAVRARRGRALPRASTRCRQRMPAVWDAMRLNHDDESVVVVPSITLDRAGRAAAA